MELDKGKASAASPEAESGSAGEFANVMTDEQVEVLRKQISIYATICEQLLEMHLAVTAHQDSIIAGVGLGAEISFSSGVGLGAEISFSSGVGLGSSSNPYCDDPVMVHEGPKFTARQRWSPTQTQLQILEGIFGQGNGTLPGRHRIKDITAELSQHGQVAENNVHNWFQNRRARSKRNLKRKQAAEASLPSSSTRE